MGAWLPLFTAVAGIIATVVTYELNPARQKAKKLLFVLNEIAKWEKLRDEALEKNDADGITAAGLQLQRLQHTKADILRQ